VLAVSDETFAVRVLVTATSGNRSATAMSALTAVVN
jgi:hypothetical protein